MKTLKNIFCFLLSLLSVPLINVDALASSADRINPLTDLLYLGAFKVPNDKSNNTEWSYGGGGMSFNPKGDPYGANDGFPGSLFGIGKGGQGYVSEYTIPSPVKSKDLSQLPSAESIQTFQDITGGIIGGTLTTYKMGDVEFIPQESPLDADKLFWAAYEFYTPEYNLDGFGWSSTTITSPDPQKLWRIYDDISSATTRYIFRIPQEWATKYVGGKTVAVGRSRGQSSSFVDGIKINIPILDELSTASLKGSWGPSLFAINPWAEGNPPADKSAFSSVTLLRYSELHPFPSPGWSRDADDWNDGAWITIGNKSAVIFAGGKGERTIENGWLYYGMPAPDGCDDKGWHAEPYYGAILFYDPNDLAAVAQGIKKPWEPRPYTIFNVEPFLFNAYTCRSTVLGGVGYDNENNLLYIEERYAGNGISTFDKSPVIHVWKLIDSKLALDTIPPSKPANIKVMDITTQQKDIIWDPSNDNSEKIVYIIYRNGLPIAITENTKFTDTKFYLYPEISTHTYDVEARDLLNNSSKIAPSPAITTITIN